MNNIITIAGDDGGRKKKGGGTNAVLTLMKELADFQDKVASCIDSQDIADRKQKLEIFYDKLDEMAEVLLVMASEGIKSKRKLEEVEETPEETPEETTVDNSMNDIVEVLSGKPKASSVGRVHMVNIPTVPRLP